MTDQNCADQEFPYIAVNERIEFPEPDFGSRTNVVATGGNLSPGMLLSAYEQGVFPWYVANEPILWWNPDPRFVLYPRQFHTGKRFVRFLRSFPVSFSIDTAFYDVITSCASVSRNGQNNTWISQQMIAAYMELYTIGYAHSVEAWIDGRLVGGLYGIAMGSVFCGESMFSIVSDASRAAFTAFMYSFIQCGGTLVDSQVYTDYLASFGAENVSREVYRRELRQGIDAEPDGGRQLWQRIRMMFPYSDWWNKMIERKNVSVTFRK